MQYNSLYIQLCFLLLVLFGCKERVYPAKETTMTTEKSAAEILGNPNYLAISYGGYRTKSRDDQPSITQLKEDL